MEKETEQQMNARIKGKEYIDSMLGPNGSYTQYGLTKREHFAGQMLAGMMLNINHVEDHIVYAQQAVAYADALLEALSKP